MSNNSFSGAHDFTINDGDFSVVRGNKNTNIYHGRKTDVYGQYKPRINRNHYGDSFRECDVGRTSRDTYIDGARPAPPGDMSFMSSPNPVYPQYQGNPVVTETLINRNHYGDDFQQSSINTTSRNVYNGYVPSPAGTGYDMRHHHQNAAYRSRNVDPHPHVHSELPPASAPPDYNPNRQRHHQEYTTNPMLHGGEWLFSSNLSDDRSQAYSRNPFENRPRRLTEPTSYAIGPHPGNQSLPAHGWSSSTAPSISAGGTMPEPWSFEDAYSEEDEDEDPVARDQARRVPPARYHHTPQAFPRGANEGWH
ncbi:hypothetical protein PQX77_021229 [Marasmius sp. AFHP31]|nr:hypothetical protein PQX77_021229 [Marasmius sp. AFHP31]